MSKLKESLRPIVYLGSNWISLIGVVLVTSAAVLWLFLLPTYLRGAASDPYIGILQFMVLPGVFFLGLALIPLGIWLEKKKNKGHMPAVFPPLDLNNRQFRKLLGFMAAATIINLVIGSQLTYRAIHYMESTQFCGLTCHTVMKPEYTAYQYSPHSRVPCVECHIGSGANWFVKSKISGSWQVISVAFNLYPRPIPTPIANLRPARETCEVCHYPQAYGGDRIRVLNTYTDDEKAKHLKTVLLLHIGGGNGYAGIHGAHMGPGVEIKYATDDPKRMKIPWVEYSRNGEKRVFPAEGYKGDGPGSMTVRTMDCMDCHNRPSHTYRLPGRAVDLALNDGRVDVTLPYVRKVAMEIVQLPYSTEAQAQKEIPERFTTYYRSNFAQFYAANKERVDKSAAGVLDAFNRNVFPDMNVKWGGYPNQIGHTDFPGCFRCHDYRETKDKKYSIPQDCDTCHKLLAEDEENPKILSDLGLSPGHTEPPTVAKGTN